MEIIRPCKEYLQSYYGACIESKGNFDYDYIMHDPELYESWRTNIFSTYEKNEKGIDLTNGFLPSATRWIVTDEKYIGTINIRKRVNDVLMNWGGTFGIIIRLKERGHGYAKQAISLIYKYTDLYKYIDDNFVVLTIETSNIASCNTFLNHGYKNIKKDIYYTNVLGKKSEVIRIIIPKEEFFRGKQ